MNTYYTKRAIEILLEEGPVELSKRTTEFILRYLFRPLDPQYSRRFKFHTWKNHLQNCIKYDAPPDPYRTLNIQPLEINHIIRNSLRKTRVKGISRIKSGDWDKKKTKVSSFPITKGIVERFEENKEWNNTKYYNYICNKYNKNPKRLKQKGYDDLEKYLYDNFRQVDKLFNKIKSEGYIENYKIQHNRPGRAQPVKDKLEVLVTIGRDGQINLFEGNHRFGIARVLDIEIPVHVICRHKKWQEIRDSIYNDGLSEDYVHLQNHPDLQDILS